jgi:hypothetical protein
VSDRPVVLLDAMTPADWQALNNYKAMGRALRELHRATKDLCEAFRKPHRRRRT